MGPAQMRSLESTLAELTAQQVTAMKDATYLGWSEESWSAYDDGLKRITELRARLWAAETPQN